MPAPDPIAGVEKQAEHFRTATAKTRERAETAAKALAGLGTTALTAVGIAKFSDVFPFPPGEGLAFAGVILGFFGMAAVLGVFTYRLWTANRPLVMTAEGQTTEDTSDAERAKIQNVYDATADLNDVASLKGYQDRAHELERMADRATDPTEADRLRSRAELIKARSERRRHARPMPSSRIVWLGSSKARRH